MPNNINSINDILVRINEIRKNVSKGKNIFETVADPIDKYFTAQKTLAKSTDNDLQAILRFSLLVDNFADFFEKNLKHLELKG